MDCVRPRKADPNLELVGRARAERASGEGDLGRFWLEGAAPGAGCKGRRALAKVIAASDAWRVWFLDALEPLELFLQFLGVELPRQAPVLLQLVLLESDLRSLGGLGGVELRNWCLLCH